MNEVRHCTNQKRVISGHDENRVVESINKKEIKESKANSRYKPNGKMYFFHFLENKICKY